MTVEELGMKTFCFVLVVIVDVISFLHFCHL